MNKARGTHLSLSEYTLAEMLKEQGYQTALFGKWHLGAGKEHGPTRQGFDTFWGHRGGFIDNYRRNGSIMKTYLGSFLKLEALFFL